MTEFLVRVERNGRHVEYHIEESSHNDTAALAAVEALRTFQRHGHGRFPYNDGHLTVTVREVEDLSASDEKA